MLNTLLAKVIGTQNERELKRLRPIVARINELESATRELSETAIRARTVELRERFGKGEALDDLLPDSFAVVREAGRRVLNMRHFDVQLIGGMVLHGGKIAEMKTGEGKTLVATLPAFLNALEGKGVHVVTVNDYLARRDSEWMGKIYRYPRDVGRRDSARAERRRAPGRLRLRHHVRHEQRVRLRLPARQHEVRSRAVRAARAPLRHRGRGGQHPHRRSEDAAHHLGSRRRVDGALLRSRPDHSRSSRPAP